MTRQTPDAANFLESRVDNPDWINRPSRATSSASNSVCASRRPIKQSPPSSSDDDVFEDTVDGFEKHSDLFPDIRYLSGFNFLVLQYLQNQIDNDQDLDLADNPPPNQDCDGNDPSDHEDSDDDEEMAFPQFSATSPDEEYEEFIKKFDRICLQKNIVDDRKLQVFNTCLSKMAESVYNGLTAAQEATYNNARDNLRNALSPADKRREEAIKKWAEMRQQPGQSVSEFYYYVMKVATARLANNAQVDNDDAKIVFLQGLYPEMRDHFVLHPPTTLADAFRVAKAAEPVMLAKKATGKSEASNTAMKPVHYEQEVIGAVGGQQQQPAEAVHCLACDYPAVQNLPHTCASNSVAFIGRGRPQFRSNWRGSRRFPRGRGNSYSNFPQSYGYQRGAFVDRRAFGGARFRGFGRGQSLPPQSQQPQSQQQSASSNTLGQSSQVQIPSAIDAKEIVCYFCQKKGHIKRDCYTRQMLMQRRAHLEKIGGMVNSIGQSDQQDALDPLALQSGYYDDDRYGYGEDESAWYDGSDPAEVFNLQEYLQINQLLNNNNVQSSIELNSHSSVPAPTAQSTPVSAYTCPVTSETCYRTNLQYNFKG